MASEMAIKAKRALLSILSSLYKYGQLPYSVYFKLFDTKIQPILLYGSEISGFKSGMFLIQYFITHVKGFYV